MSGSMAIEGKRTWQGSLSFDDAADPMWAVDDLVWLEQKESGLTRPIFRRRARVLRCEREHGATTYHLIQVTPAPQEGIRV
jgi:hypothetical protein